MKRGKTDLLPAPARDILALEFTETLTETYTRDGEKYDVVFDAAPLDEDHYLIIESSSLRSPEDDSVWASSPGSISLRIVDPTTKKWAGISATVYGPSIEYDRTDVADVEPAYVSNSTSSEKSTAATRANAKALVILADLADTWTEAATPDLIEAARASNEEWQQQRAARKAEREQQRVVLDKRVPAIGNQVRVKLTGKKVPLVGELVGKDSSKITFEVKVAYRDEPITVSLSDVERLERKDGNSGRFQELTLS